MVPSSYYMLESKDRTEDSASDNNHLIRHDIVESTFTTFTDSSKQDKVTYYSTNNSGDLLNPPEVLW